jgi:hypothetical protein
MQPCIAAGTDVSAALGRMIDARAPVVMVSSIAAGIAKSDIPKPHRGSIAIAVSASIHAAGERDTEKADNHCHNESVSHHFLVLHRASYPASSWV